MNSILRILIIAFSALTALAQPTRTVNVNTNGALVYPDATTFFAKNFYDGSVRPIYFGSSQNIGFGTTNFGSSAVKVISIGSGTAPTTSPADAVQAWAADLGGSAGKAALHLRSEDGTTFAFGENTVIGGTSPTVFAGGRTLTIVGGTSSPGRAYLVFASTNSSTYSSLGGYSVRNGSTYVADVIFSTGSTWDSGEYQIWTASGGVLAQHWVVKETGTLQSIGPKTIGSSYGDLTFTAGGSIILVANGVAVADAHSSGELRPYSHVVPQTNLVSNLGSASKQFAAIYGSNVFATNIVADSLSVREITATSITGSGPNPIEKRVAQMIARGNGTVTIDTLGDNLSASAGTVTAVNPTSTEGAMVKWATAASATARAYFGGGSNYRKGRNLRFSTTIKVNQTTSVRYWVGLTDVSPSTFADADDPGSAHIAGFRFSTAAGDTTWRCITKDGTTLGNTDSGVSIGTDLVRLEVVFDDTAGNCVFKINGTTVATRTTNLPGTSVNLAFIGTAYAQNSAAKEIQFSRATIVSDE